LPGSRLGGKVSSRTLSKEGTANGVRTTATPRQLAEFAFAAWSAGTGYFTDLLADDVRWTIAGNSLASRTYSSKQEFIDEVLAPFGRRFRTPFRPVTVRGIYEDGDTAIVVWDGEGIALDGAPYINT